MQEQYIQLKSGHRIYTQSHGPEHPLILTIHGGPGFSHGMFGNFPEHLNAAGIGVVLYDQLGGGKSDRPDDSSLWQIERFVEELHEVVVALELQGQYALASSWGVILLTEYMLRYPLSFKGIILSGMPTSFQKFKQNVLLLRSQLPEEVLKQFEEMEKEGKAGSEAYMGLLLEQWLQRHYCLLKEWPQPLMECFLDASYPVMQEMIGLSPFFFSGSLLNWRRSQEELRQITTPALLVDFPQDVVLREDYQPWLQALPNSSYVICSRGGHLGWWDNPEEFFPAVERFIKSIEKASGKEMNGVAATKKE